MKSNPHSSRHFMTARLAGHAAFLCVLSSLSDLALGAKSTPEKALRQASPALTVEELVHQTSQALASGAWQTAVEHCQALLRDYGDRPEIMRLKGRVQLTLLRCHLHLGEWSEAAPLFDVALHLLSSAPPAAKGELLLQKAACLLRLAQHSPARQSIDACLLLLPPTAPLRLEAVLLLAACLLGEGSPLEAGTLLETTLVQFNQAQTLSALLQGMRAFLEAHEPERAHTLFTAGARKYPPLADRIGLQLLLLQSGTELLEQQKPAEALACLAHVSTPQRLLHTQRQRLAALEKTGTAAATMQTQAAQLREELDALGSGEMFAATTRIQVAAAYRALDRTHEAALVLDDAAQRLPPSEPLEIACLELAKAWLQLERWQRAIDACLHFAATYPHSKHRPLMLYLQGCAEQKAGLFSEAHSSFSNFLKDHKTHELCASALFMQPFTHLLDERTEEAAQGFGAFLKAHKTHPLSEAAAYWLCVARTRSGPPALLQTVTNAYLKSFGDGENRPSVLLMRAQASRAAGDKSAAVSDLEKLIAEAPEHPCTGEAALLLGDCLLALGKIDAALAAWGGIPAEQPEARAEGLLKSAKILHRNGQTKALRQLLLTFESRNATTPRLAELAHWLWKACVADGLQTDAAAWILDQVALHGDNPAASGIEPLLTVGARLAREDAEWETWNTLLKRLLIAADEADQPTLSSRLQWALATHDTAQKNADSKQLLIEAASRNPAALTGAAVLADGAAAAEEAGRPLDALRLWRDLLRWHPRAPQRDRAFYGLASLDFNAQRHELAREWIRRFEKSSASSPLVPRMRLLKTRLQQSEGKTEDALQSLDQLLRDKAAGASAKCEALYSIGAIHLAGGKPRLALPYLQRVYVSYARFQPWAAKAYLSSAEIFTTLGDHAAARNTYRELLASGLAPDAPERVLATEKLKAFAETP
jgi:tetratricopeptide (TPR) repeat protein